MPSVVSKIKDALHGDHDTRQDHRSAGADLNDERVYDTHGHGSSNIPGSYPGQDQGGSQAFHQDGREYVPPKGTAVNQTHSGGLGSGNTHNQPGFHNNNPGYGTQSAQDRPLGQVQPGHRHNEVTDDRKLMDPSSRGTDSNVLGGTGRTTGSGLDSHSSGPNKLRRHDDPRGNDSSTFGSSNTTTGHQGQGSHLHDKISQPTQRDRNVDDQYGSQPQHRGDPDRTHGNPLSHHDPGRAGAIGVQGVAGGLAGSQIPDRSRQHDDNSRYTSHGNETHGTTGTLGQHDHTSRGDHDGSRGGTYNGVIGAGSNEELGHGNRGSGPGPTIGSHHDPRSGNTSGLTGHGNVPREAGDGRHTTGGQGLGAAGAAGLAAAGVGAGAYGASQSNNYRDQRHGEQYPVGGGHGFDSSTGHGGPEFQQGQQQRGTAHDGRDLSHQQHGAGGHISQGLNQQQGPGGTIGQGPLSRNSNADSSRGTGSSGLGSEGIHPGAKVLHKCTHCGQDNDISHYLKKDLVYRIDQ